jgi:hypothetical protein
VAVLVVVGVPIFGSDVGGIIAFTPTVLVFAVLATGYRLRLRIVLAGLEVTVAAVTAFGLLDLARPQGQRAHLGRLFERVGDEGLEPLVSIMERKLLANLGVTTSSFWVAVIPIAVAFLVFLSRYPTEPMARLREHIPVLRAGVAASITAAVLGSAVNDSGAIVGGVTLFIMVSSLVWLALDLTGPPMVAAGDAAGVAAATAASAAAPGSADVGDPAGVDDPPGAGGPDGSKASPDGAPPARLGERS